MSSTGYCGLYTTISSELIHEPIKQNTSDKKAPFFVESVMVPVIVRSDGSTATLLVLYDDSQRLTRLVLVSTSDVCELLQVCTTFSSLEIDI